MGQQTWLLLSNVAYLQVPSPGRQSVVASVQVPVFFILTRMMAPSALASSRPTGVILILPVAKVVSKSAVLMTPLMVTPMKLEAQLASARQHR